jgi:uncharacterized protein (TIGR03083 family)
MTDNDAGQRALSEVGRAARDALGETWGGLAEASYELSETEWALPTECPGWDVKDQLSHVIAVERTILGEPAPEWDGPLGDHVKNDFARSNEAWIAVRRPRSGPEVRAEFVQVTEQRLALLGQLSGEEWEAVGWSPLGPRPLAEFMEVRVFDCWVHEQDVRDATDRPGHEDGPVAEQSVDEIVRALGFIVGKKAAAPAGANVTFELTGPVVRTVHVAVDGRAAVVDQLPGPATATVTLGSRLFSRLACGRVDPVQKLGEVQLTGDTDLGRRVVASLPFTI